jgi:hypothetical protein
MLLKPASNCYVMICGTSSWHCHVVTRADHWPVVTRADHWPVVNQADYCCVTCCAEQYDKAEGFMQRAVRLAPDHHGVLCNYAGFLQVCHN